jgi:glycosyltransferase involved in cell wall biosynthesis
MPEPARLSATVLVCTYERADLLRTTLQSLHRLNTARSWEILVVDNNSRDHTREVVHAFAHASHVPVQYVFEPRQGKSHALNTGLSHVRGDIVVFTDDDVQVAPHWLDRACEPLETEHALDYTGGPVRPLWGSPPPDWLDQTRADLWGTLAILDYGQESFIFEERRRVPLGVNMAIRRSLVDRIGGFHPELGRRGRSLLGQEQAEFFARARARGVRGRYVPAMEVWHHVSPTRLTRQYFRTWWYWKGVSRARVEGMHRQTELGLDLTRVPHVASVPRYVWGQLPRGVLQWARAVLAGDRYAAMRHHMSLMFALGYVRGCWSRERLTPLRPQGGHMRRHPAAPATDPAVPTHDRAPSAPR